MHPYPGFDPFETEVQDLKVTAASYGAQLSWTLLDNNCDTYGYKIYYRETDEERPQSSML